MNGFTTKNDLQPGWLGRFFGTKPKKQALVEANNLLASNNVLDITAENITTIGEKYGVDLNKAFLQERKEMLSTLVDYYLSELQLGEPQLKNIHHFISLVGLSEADYLSIHGNLSKQVFEREAVKLITRKSNIEKTNSKLNKLGSSISIKKEIAQKVIDDRCNSVLNQFLDEIIEAERFPPEKEKEWNSLRGSFGFSKNLDDNTKKLLATYRTLSQIDAGELPDLEVPINFERSEICHFYIERCDWRELRKVVKKVIYGGPIARIRITKELTYRFGSITPAIISDDEMTHLDTGELYLTNKRIIFTGSKGSKNIRLNKILDFQVWANGVDIRKDAGKNPFLQFDEDIDVFGAILQKAISNY